MKKKILYSLLLITLLAFTTGCGGKNDSKESKTKEQNIETEATTVEEPTTEPLPTAEVSITENSDGTSQVDNKTAGYNVSYDSKLLKMSNTDSTISFTPSDEKTKEELNLFLTITETNPDAAKELGKQLKKSYKGSVEKNQTKLGTSKTPATCYSITDTKKMTHEVYVISSEEKGWYIELKCPSKYEKKYLTAFEDILGSMDFSATITE